MKTFTFSFLLRILIVFLSTICTTQAQKTSEILWDNYGVPHVYARTEAEMYYAFGWAQMHNHANLLLRLYGQARGRAAEYWGEQYLDSDKQMHLFNIPDSAQAHYARQTAGYKPLLDAFVAGINAYGQAHPALIDSTMRSVLPVTGADVLAHATRVICLEFLAGRDLALTQRQIAPGSNAYAIGASRSASGKAMLMTNPHLPWSDFFTFFEADLHAPGFHAYGVAIVGQPMLNIAFNDKLGWTHTVNTIDASDRYELALQDGGYLLDGKVEPFQTKSVQLKVRQSDGNQKTQSLTFRYAKHGPVQGAKGAKAYAIRIAGLESAFAQEQWHQMAKAQNFAEFETALKRLQSPMFNVIYADQAGNILYFFNGNVPKRAEGDWTFWQNTIDGRDSKYIWTQYHSYDDLPKVFNPPTGFVQNANDSPWTCTYPMVLKPENFPAYMSPRETTLRPQRAINLLKDDVSVTFDELVGYKLNTGMEAADRFLDDLLAAVRQHPDTMAIKAAEVLQKWNKTTDADSRGAVLFAQWFDKLNEGMFSKPWNPSEPVTTPDGLRDPRQAVDLLVKAATEVAKQYGRLDVAWGDVNRFKIGAVDLPANGGADDYGIFRTMYFSPNKTANKNYAFAGDTYVAITEFGSSVRAKVLLSYGNASQPGSKHNSDQLPLLAQKKLRTALFTREEVLKNLEKQEYLPKIMK